MEASLVLNTIHECSNHVHTSHNVYYVSIPVVGGLQALLSLFWSPSSVTPRASSSALLRSLTITGDICSNSWFSLINMRKYAQ